jgi:hypothetical protein
LNDLADKLYAPGMKEIEELKELKKVKMPLILYCFLVSLNIFLS